MAKHPTFFQLFAGIVDHSRLSQAEIARRTNEANGEPSLAFCSPINRATVNRIYRSIDLPSTFTLYRIAKFGLAQTEEQCAALEKLRQVEARTHTTSHHKVPTQAKTSLREA
jgi:transcriptional regulator with XRE-family HTH domain